MLFFKVLCFVWAAIGILSRVAMGLMKDNWNKWETEKAYSEKKPAWIYLVSLIGLALIVVTWYMYFTYDVSYGWILGVLISLTSIKIFTLMFNYNEFRKFLAEALNNKKKMLNLNIAVIILSVALIGMGIWLY